MSETPPWVEWVSKLREDYLIVGEVKPFSPFGFDSPYSREESLDRILPHVDVISIHTDPLWGGSRGWLATAVSRCGETPVLAKGFHPTTAHVEECLMAGAIYVLTVGWWPEGQSYANQCWHELAEDDWSDSIAPMQVLNARNPRTGKMRWPFDPPRRIIAEHGHRICQASGINGPEGVWPDAKALLIGEALNR